jgi:hypothetical protein
MAAGFAISRTTWPPSSTPRKAGPHAIIWTSADEVNQALLDFIGHPGQVG